MNKQTALKKVIDAAGIHADRMNESIANGDATGSFAVARKKYVQELQVAVSALAGTRFDESGKVAERVRDLDLAESVALMYALEDHIRSITRYSSHA